MQPKLVDSDHKNTVSTSMPGHLRGTHLDNLRRTSVNKPDYHHPISILHTFQTCSP